jgi:hypothetical protein
LFVFTNACGCLWYSSIEASSAFCRSRSINTEARK